MNFVGVLSKPGKVEREIACKTRRTRPKRQFAALSLLQRTGPFAARNVLRNERIGLAQKSFAIIQRCPNLMKRIPESVGVYARYFSLAQLSVAAWLPDARCERPVGAC